MSVEQTTQLIQLILNSMLMIVACALLLSRITTRQTLLEESLQAANRQCLELLGLSGERWSEGHGADRSTSRALQAKKHLRQLQHRYKVVRYSVLANAYALMCAIASTLSLSLRALINLEWLVPIALGLFVFGVTLLLLGVGLMLLDLHTADRTLWDDVTTLLIGRPDDKLRNDWQQRSKVAERFMRRQASSLRTSSKARVS